MGKLASEYIAEFNSGRHSISDSAIQGAITCFLDHLTMVELGTKTQLARILRQTLPGGDGGPDWAVASASRMSPSDAALYNGTVSHALDYDDVELISEAHPSVVGFPAIIAAGEIVGASLREALKSFAYAVETMRYVGSLMNPDHYGRGWHATGTVCTYGAAFGAGRILSLNEEQMVHAMGIAGTSSSGIQVAFGTMSKPYVAGRSAENGIRAALLAKGGFTGPKDVFEGRAGVFQLFGFNHKPEGPIRPHGGKWTVENLIFFKQFASCFATHGPMRAALKLRSQLEPDQIERVKIVISPYSYEQIARRDHDNEIAARFSVSYCVAVILALGRAGNPEFLMPVVNDPMVRHLADISDIGTDSAFGKFDSIIELKSKSGKVVSFHEKVIDPQLSDVSDEVGPDTSFVDGRFVETLGQRLGTKQAQALRDQIRTKTSSLGLSDVLRLVNS